MELLVLLSHRGYCNSGEMLRRSKSTVRRQSKEGNHMRILISILPIVELIEWLSGFQSNEKIVINIIMLLA